MGSTKLIAKCLEDMIQNALVTCRTFVPENVERDIFVGDGVQVLAESSITMCHD